MNTWSTEKRVATGNADAGRASGPIASTYGAWKRAETAARALEREVKETWSRYERGIGAPPSTGLLREAASLRHAAREKLGDVVGLLQAAGAIPSSRPLAA
jgi:hypothetical protein